MTDFVVRVSPKYERPEHLSPIIPYIDTAMEGNTRVCFSAPPRHGKSSLLFHAIARFMAKHPDRNVAYVSYTATLAERKGEEIKELVKRAGVELATNSKAKDTWRTAAGGYFFARGPGGPLTGDGVHLMVVDDPYHGRGAAESATVRDNIWDWWTSVALTRIERPPGCSDMGSVILSHTRWHQEDLIGRMVRDKGWDYVNLPAINDDGAALWPSRMTLEDLAVCRATNEYDWASMYQGDPRPRGGALFSDVSTYPSDPAPEYKKFVIGLDLAYSAKTHADWSVAVVLGVTTEGTAHIVDVRRRQCEVPVFASILKELRNQYRNAPICWFVGPTEKGTADLLKTMGVPIKTVPAKGDKYIRALESSNAWNAKKILVPLDHTVWASAFLNEVLGFTGLGDLHDDQVDALAAAYFMLAKPPPARGVGQKRLLPF